MLYADLFNEDYLKRSPETGIVYPRGTNYLRKLYGINWDLLSNYYLSRNFGVRNTHILSRFLEHVSPHLGYDTYRYMEYINTRLPYLAKHFKFTSDTEKGIVHPPYFYGNNGDEVILISDEYVSPNEVIKNWQTYPCVKVLKHPRNDIKMLLPLGRNDESRGGLSILVINLAVLALKYREFVRVQWKNSVSGEGAVLNKNFFIVKHVLMPMMRESTDHVVLNRLMDKFYKREIVVPKFKHRFLIREPEKLLNSHTNLTLKTITSKKMDFENIMRNIKLLYKEDSTELLPIPNMAGTRQSRWALVVSRLEHMCFIYDVAVDKGRGRKHINDWKRLVKRIDQDKGMLGDFSYVVSKKTEEYMDKIKDM